MLILSFVTVYLQKGLVEEIIVLIVPQPGYLNSLTMMASNERRVSTERETLLSQIFNDFGRSWMITVWTREYLINTGINKNNVNNTIMGKPIAKRKYVCLRSDSRCAGKVYSMEKKNKCVVLFKCGLKLLINVAELIRIEPLEYREKDPHFKIERTYIKHLYVHLIRGNMLGFKLFKDRYLKRNDYKDEILSRLDKCCKQFYCGKVGDRRDGEASSSSSTILHSNPSGNVQNNDNIVNGYDDEKYDPFFQQQQPQPPQLQETSTTTNPESGEYLRLFVFDSMQIINRLNRKCPPNPANSNIKKNIYFDVNRDMDGECLNLYHILRYFVSQSIETQNRNGSIFKNRDRDGDRLIASWIINHCKLAFSKNKYEAFIKQFEINYVQMTKEIEQWCKKNHKSISCQMEEQKPIRYMDGNIENIKPL